MAAARAYVHPGPPGHRLRAAGSLLGLDLLHDGILSPVPGGFHTDDEFGPALIYPYDPHARRLDELLARNVSMSRQARLQVIRGIADSLRYAHDRGVTHRGLSPRSVLVSPGDGSGPAVKLTDWQGAAAEPDADNTESLLLGTANVDALLADDSRWYRAPEIGTATRPDLARADVFSLGAIAFALLGGGFPATGAMSLRSRLTSDGGLWLNGSAADVPPALAELVYQATRADAGQRIPDVDTFIALLDEATDVIPAAKPDTSSAAGARPGPGDATPGDIVAGRWRIVRELGSGSTARAFLVADTSAGNARKVLKVARGGPDADTRLRDEASILERLDHPAVVRLTAGPITVDGRAALVTELAGGQTLKALLSRQSGPLPADQLERLGDDLLEVAAYLARRSVHHRDVKPANLGVRRDPGGPRLVLFDFSHSNVPSEAVEAGTRLYRDPFLGPEPLPGLPHRPRWDDAAEQYAVAVTLFEMATGKPPQYGDGKSDPLAVADEARISPDMFTSLARPQRAEITSFFRQALRRDAGQRFPDIAAMRAAWPLIFYNKAQQARPGPRRRRRPPTAAGAPAPPARPSPRDRVAGPSAAVAATPPAHVAAGAINVHEFARQLGVDSQVVIGQLDRRGKNAEALRTYEDWLDEVFPQPDAGILAEPAPAKPPQAQPDGGIPAEPSPAKPPQAQPDAGIPAAASPARASQAQPEWLKEVLPDPGTANSTTAAARPAARSGPARPAAVPPGRPPAPASVLSAVALMRVGAVMSLISAIVALTISSDLKTAFLEMGVPVGNLSTAVDSTVFVCVILSLASVGTWILIARASRQGRRWARHAGTVLFALATALAVPISRVRSPGAALLLGEFCVLIVWLAGFSAVVFLWQPSSAAFFRQAPARGELRR